jgi:methionine synthase I (cobalamin-dependent)
MEQRDTTTFAATRSVPIKYRMEECAQRMEQRGNDAASRDAPHMPRNEEFVGDIVRKESRQTTT